MTPGSGAISLYDVAVASGRGASNISLGDTITRNMAKVTAGSYGMNSLYGKPTNLSTQNVTFDSGNGGAARAVYCSVTGGSSGASITLYAEFVNPYQCSIGSYGGAVATLDAGGNLGWTATGAYYYLSAVSADDVATTYGYVDIRTRTTIEATYGGYTNYSGYARSYY